MRRGGRSQSLHTPHPQALQRLARKWQVRADEQVPIHSRLSFFVQTLQSHAVRSKTPTAMVNEVLAKLVCFNLTCVIHEWYELGIDPAVWGMPKREMEADPPAVIPFMRPAN